MQNISPPKDPLQELFYFCQLTDNVFCITHIKQGASPIFIDHEGEDRKSPNEVWSF